VTELLSILAVVLAAPWLVLATMPNTSGGVTPIVGEALPRAARRRVGAGHPAVPIGRTRGILIGWVGGDRELRPRQTSLHVLVVVEANPHGVLGTPDRVDAAYYWLSATSPQPGAALSALVNLCTGVSDGSTCPWLRDSRSWWRIGSPNRPDCPETPTPHSPDGAVNGLYNRDPGEKRLPL